MTALEQMLTATAAEIDWPETPNLAAAVVPRMSGVTPRQIGDSSADPARRAEARTRRLRRPVLRFGRPLAIALAALLVLAASALAIPSVRDWLGLSTVEVERVPKPLPEVPGARLSLGTHVSLDAARAKLGFAPVVPRGIGTPAVYYDPFPPGGQLGLVYSNGIVITELQGRLERYIAKFLPPGTGMDRLTIDGEHALWIHGALHQYAYADRTGQLRTDSVRTAGDVLLWRRGDLLVRIEGARSRQQAVAIATSAREAP
jgi:hypothetical protein